MKSLLAVLALFLICSVPALAQEKDKQQHPAPQAKDVGHGYVPRKGPPPAKAAPHAAPAEAPKYSDKAGHPERAPRLLANG